MRWRSSKPHRLSFNLERDVKVIVFFILGIAAITLAVTIANLVIEIILWIAS